MKISPVILCGGSGTRLWPLSREAFPKQFIKLNKEQSLFQNTLNRIIALQNEDISIDKIIIVSNEKHRFLISQQINDLEIETQVEIILEPFPKNTAPALTLASYATDKDSIMIVLPSDHVMKNDMEFLITIRKAIKHCSANTICTLGIRPTSANTGYGYIKSHKNNDYREVTDFIEKPDEKNAKKMIKDGTYSWNAGIFILSPSTWLNCIEVTNNEIFNLVKKSWDVRKIDQWFTRPDKNAYDLLTSDSIDYAVMEKTNDIGIKVVLLNLDAGWDDMGTFNSFKKYYAKDKYSNTKVGDVTDINSSNNIAISTSRNISLVDVENLIVVETKDAVLVSNIDKSENIKSVVECHRLDKSSLIDEHVKVYKPWGWYESLETGTAFKVKRIQIDPKKAISLQRHQHRSEHWIVIQGQATVTKGDDIFKLNANESTYIEKMEIHRLENKSDEILQIIEVQSGIELSEDDIERLEDNYGR